MKKILLIEDDITLNNLIKESIEKYGYEVKTIDNFENIEKEFQELCPDLVLLDINLPYSDGFQLCRSFRRESKVPIIFISARSNYTEQIRALESGGDDYIVKPFDVELLLAKIQAVFRRTYGEYSETVTQVSLENGLSLNKNNFEMSYKNNTVELSKKEFQLMSKLVEKENAFVSREELLEELWDEKYFIDDHTLTVNITRVKNKLASLGHKDVIKTKRGAGYMFVSAAAHNKIQSDGYKDEKSIF